jgi:hypothetical protein
VDLILATRAADLVTPAVLPFPTRLVVPHAAMPCRGGR